jgi:penicillin-binding protein-related factor A (putative recombinase)
MHLDDQLRHLKSTSNDFLAKVFMFFLFRTSDLIWRLPEVIMIAEWERNRSTILIDHIYNESNQIERV